jgi:hypothetical protein
MPFNSIGGKVRGKFGERFAIFLNTFSVINSCTLPGRVATGILRPAKARDPHMPLVPRW